MADPASPDGASAPEAAPEQPPENGVPTLRVLAQFTKDLSFENPGILATPAGAQAPEIELGIDVRVEPGPPKDRIFSVDLRMSAKAKRAESIVFIVDLTYTGVFQVGAVAPADVETILLIECPRLLFPFARRILAEVTRDGGHPPLFVDPIDFVSLYRRQKAADGSGSAVATAPAEQQS